MTLSDAQLAELTEQGFLVLPGLFTADEVDRLCGRLPALFADGDPANIVEKDSGEVRTSMGLHLRDALFARLVRHSRLLGPAQQLYPEPLYIQQVKVNVKAAFSGEVWQWHYDFATHREEDGVPRPLALNLHVFLDDVTEFNGPLWFIPRSHQHGEFAATLDVQTTSYPLWVVDDATVGRPCLLAAQRVHHVRRLDGGTRLPASLPLVSPVRRLVARQRQGHDPLASTLPTRERRLNDKAVSA